ATSGFGVNATVGGNDNVTVTTSLQLTGAGVNGSVATLTGAGTTPSQGTLTGPTSGGNKVGPAGGRPPADPGTPHSRPHNASMTVSGGASMVNDAGKTWNLTGATINSGTGGGTFTNQGTLNASNTNTIGVVFNNTNDGATANSATVNVTSGKLALTGTGT